LNGKSKGQMMSESESRGKAAATIEEKDIVRSGRAATRRAAVEPNSAGARNGAQAAAMPNGDPPSLMLWGAEDENA
jgi:hypothetical protein